MNATTWKLKDFSTNLVPLYDEKKKSYSVYTKDAEEVEVPEALFRKLFVETEKAEEISETSHFEQAFSSMKRSDQESMMTALGVDIDKVYEETRQQTKQQLKDSQMWDILKNQVKMVLRAGGSAEALSQVTTMLIPPNLTAREKEMFATLVAENIEEAKREEGM